MINYVYPLWYLILSSLTATQSSARAEAAKTDAHAIRLTTEEAEG